uniref:Nucleolus and neural progenitor protein-like N-terminal domain-containing protein n=1 Tax=Cucumis sativus TaxID=3659 RepID=A0A0A0LBJ0_CUCSA
MGDSMGSTEAGKLQENLKRRKCEVGKYNFMERLLGAVRLLSQMVEPIFKAATEISILLARTFFPGFCFVILALLARIRVLVQQILLDVVSVFNTVSSISKKKQVVAINQERIQVFREFYPTNDEYVLLECIWEVDKFILKEKKNEIATKNQEEHIAPDFSLATSAMRYQKLRSFLGDDESEEAEDHESEEADANESNEKGLDLMKTTPNGLLASPSGSVNDISMEDNTETKDGLISPVKTTSKTFLPQEGNSLVNSSPPMPSAKKPNSKRPAFVSVELPKPITSGGVGIQFNESKVDSVEKENPFFTLLTGGKAKSSLF